MLKELFFKAIGFLKPYVWYIGIVLAIVLTLQIKIWLLQSDLTACKADNINLLAMLKANEILQEQKNKDANKINEALEKAYQERLKHIQEIKADETQSDCNNAISLLRANF
jgi:hypothetical protein